MGSEGYLGWLAGTKTRWWHDSADPGEVDRGIARGASGATTNPMLSSFAIAANRELWGPQIRDVFARGLDGERKAEELLRIAVVRTAEKFLPEFERSGGGSGFVCGQVNPNRPGDRGAMLAAARRYREWAPNIAVKLPATAAGLDVLEDALAEGTTVTATVSFTVPQAVAIAERCRAGIRRARAAGIVPGKCFAVIMIGRLDDFIREVAADNRAEVTEGDIRKAGIAVTKRAYGIYVDRRYEAKLLVAAFRGIHHATEIAGGDLILSVFPSWQEPLMSRDLPREERIGEPVEREVVERLSRIPEFRRAYEPDGMRPEEFVGYGATQRTLSQFCEMGWNALERFRP